jgi:Ca2+-binding RTX toxin-like protein
MMTVNNLILSEKRSGTINSGAGNDVIYGSNDNDVIYISNTTYNKTLQIYQNYK